MLNPRLILALSTSGSTAFFIGDDLPFGFKAVSLSTPSTSGYADIANSNATMIPSAIPEPGLSACLIGATTAMLAICRRKRPGSVLPSSAHAQHQSR